jgi:hypothetical protein
MVVTMKFTFFWDETLCSLVDTYHLERKCGPHLQGIKVRESASK